MRRNFRSAVTAAWSIWLIVFLSGCAGFLPMAKKAQYPTEVTPAMRAEFDQAEGFYSRHEFDQSFTSYQHYIDTYGYNRLTDEALYKQGKIKFLGHDFVAAAELFATLAPKTPDPVYRAKADHMTGYARYKANDLPGAQAVLGKLKADLLPPLLRIQYYSLLVFVAQASNQNADQADYAALRLYDLYEQEGRQLQNVNAPDVLSQAQVKTNIDTWIARPLASGEFPSWMKKYPDGGPAKAFVDYKIARTYYEAQDAAKARRLFTVFVNRYPKNVYAASATNFLKELGGPDKSLATGEKFRVGVLLPLAGGQSGFGDSVLRGIKCGAGADGACGGNTNVEVVTRDSGFAPDTVRMGIDQLQEEKVAAVISILPGPLAVEAAMYAAQKNMPILLISQQDGLMHQGAGVFQLGLSPERQVEELVDSARDKGMKNIAIFAPNIPYGQKMADLFSHAWQEQGGRIAARVSYLKESPPDIFMQAHRLKTDLDSVQPADQTDHTIVDGVFIPDTYGAVNDIAGALESSQLTGFPLIGTNTWNDPGLSSSIATSFPGSFFVDLYDSSANSTEVQDFKERFSGSFGGDPQVLNALGFDAMMMVRSAVSSGGAGRLQETLGSHLGYRGVTGISGFKAGDAPIIKPRVIKVGGAS